MTKIHDISTHEITFNDVFLFDTNVWMFLFCPIGNYKAQKQKKYSSFFDKLVRNKGTIFINSLILSEFSNAYLRLDYNLWKDKPENRTQQLDYKRDFTQTQQFKETVGDVKIALKNILKITERCNDDFSSINFDRVLTNFGNTDFNDSYYLETAQKNKWKVVTDDADYFNVSSNIEIITANIR